MKYLDEIPQMIRFLLGQLSEADKDAFERRLRSDEQFRNDLHLLRVLREKIDIMEDREQLRNRIDEIRNSRVGRKNWKLFSLLILVILAFFGVSFYWNSDDSEISKVGRRTTGNTTKLTEVQFISDYLIDRQRGPSKDEDRGTPGMKWPDRNTVPLKKVDPKRSVFNPVGAEKKVRLTPLPTLILTRQTLHSLEKMKADSMPVASLKVDKNLKLQSCIAKAKEFVENEYFDEAEEMLTIGLNVFNAPSEIKSEQLAQLSAIFVKTGNFQKAVTYGEILLTKANPSKFDFDPKYLDSLEGLLIAYSKLRRYKEAFILYEDLLRNQASNFDDINPNYIQYLERFAALFQEIGRYENAYTLYKKALVLRKKINGSEFRDLAMAYNNLGSLFNQKGNFDRAVQYFDKALRVLEFSDRQVGKNTTFTADVVKNLNLIGKASYQDYRRTSNLNSLYQGRVYMQRAIATLDYQQFQNRGNDIREMYRDRKGFDIYHDAIHINYSLAEITGNSDFLEECFALSERSKSHIEYLEAQESGAISSMIFPNTLLEKEHKLRMDVIQCEGSKMNSFTNGLSKNSLGGFTIADKCFSLKQKYKSLKQKLTVEPSNNQNLRFTLGATSIKQIQEEVLNREETLMEYFVGDSAIFVFIIKPDSYEVSKISRDFLLDSLVLKMREGIVGNQNRSPNARTMRGSQSYLQEYVQSAIELYDHLISPVEHLLSKSVIIVPDGILRHLPFDALLTGPVSHLQNFGAYPYLLKKHVVSYAHSAGMLVEMRKGQVKAKAGKQLLALAPFFDEEYLIKPIKASGSLNSVPSNKISSRLAGRRFEALPASREEVKNVAQIFKGKSLTGDKATKDAFIKTAKNYRILHLSTHGVIYDQVGESSHIAFASISEDTAEKDILTVEEIYNLKLNADLVVLSACETGLERIKKGEGVLSLARGFAYAGARSVITSLWQTNDRSSKEMMINFYQSLSLGYSKDAALHNAKLRFIQKNDRIMSHPYFWAGFCLLGSMAAL